MENTKPVKHVITIPSANNVPDPSGTPINANQPSPTPDNPWLCRFPCTVPGHTDTVDLLWDGTSFDLTNGEANDPTFWMVTFTYNPPLH